VKRILVTRPRAQADSFGEGLRAAGFEPVYFPVIEIHPIEDSSALNKAFEQLHCYAWVIFTSVNAVDMVFDKFSNFSGAGVKFAAIGPKTAEALKARGITPDFIPQEYVAEAILPGLGDLKGKWILLPRAEIARKELSEAIVKTGGIAHEISVYKTLPTQPDPDGLAALKSGVDVITFTSASAVAYFVAVVRQNKLDPLNLPNNPLFACIGPITEQAARAEGLLNLVVAKEYTTDGLIEAIRSRETL
jgi:uroporphyrinogen III methyltransferase / synthase